VISVENWSLIYGGILPWLLHSLEQIEPRCKYSFDELCKLFLRPGLYTFTIKTLLKCQLDIITIAAAKYTVCDNVLIHLSEQNEQTFQDNY
jgi:hypothetical protein